MSDETPTAAAADDDIAPLPEAPQPESAAPAAAPPPEEEADLPDAVDVEGQPMVPLAAIKSMREELKAAKAKAAEAEKVQEEVNRIRPYVDFVAQNQQLFRQGQQPPEAPKPPVEGAAAVSDDEALAYAKDLELWNTKTGTYDLDRAKRRIAEDRKKYRAEAEAIVNERLQPLKQQGAEQRAAVNLQQLAQTKDAYGRPVNEQYLAQVLEQPFRQLGRDRVIDILSEPAAAQLFLQQAAVLQTQREPVTQPQRVGDALHVERAGGATRYVMTDSERRLARENRISEKDWIDSAKKIKDGGYNALED